MTNSPIKTLPITRIAALLAIGLSLGCSGSSSNQEGGTSYPDRAEAAFMEAEEALDDGNYAYALTLFREVRDNYELSPYAVMAELRLADTNFEQGSYLQAAEAYRQFVQLHPTHAAVPYARFGIGMSYYEDMPSDFFILPPPYERELGSTRSAEQALGDFLERYRASEDPEIQGYVAIASEAYIETLDRLAGYEFYVAEFYLERERPVASAERLRILLEQYPSSTYAPSAMFLLARCYVELSDVESALEALRQLTELYPDHELTQEAREWMTQHQLSFSDVQPPEVMTEGQRSPVR